MSYRIMFISSMYQGSLESFYKRRYNDIKDLSFEHHYNLLMEDTTEFIGSYTRGLRKLGMDARSVIVNDNYLQSKWIREFVSEKPGSKKLLFSQVDVFQPEILWIDNLNYVDREWLDMIRKNVKSIRLIAGYHCSPYGPKIIDALKAVDIVITCTPGLKSEIESMGKHSFLVYHGFDDTLIPKIVPGKCKPEYNLVFSGSLTTGGRFHDERRKIIEDLLEEDIDMRLYVNLEKEYKIRAKQAIFVLTDLVRRLNIKSLKKQTEKYDFGKNMPRIYSGKLVKSCQYPLYGIEMYNLLSRSKIVLNMHIGVAGDYAGNMRLFEATGAGSCLLTDNKKNIGDLFDPGREVVIFNDAKDCVTKAKWLLKNEAERKRIALSGQARTLKSHTVHKRCEQILEILEKEINQNYH